ncbi:MAG: hypothetical protein IT361_02330 [Gemmatimonadaceae bacterium]|nr:hypothetical protein [Gemmatimonadaceae bacterium]
MMHRGSARALSAFLALFTGSTLGAQHVHAEGDSAGRFTIGAMGVAVFTHVRPGALARNVTEGYLTQPMLMAGARSTGGRLQALLMLNAEGATLDRGEIGPGIYGEGYIDRRHPHTWLHEVMVGVQQPLGMATVALFAGKGFVPYGTDDPMVRPFVKFPVNHHHAQLLERAMLTAAASAGPASVEVARFNGDEPESPSDWPNRDRGLDSWAVRATWLARGSVELSASAASVHSPEFANGDGLDQRKAAASVRLTPTGGFVRYALIEGARTREYSGDRRVFEFSSLLAEAEGRAGRLVLAARMERTTRPEEERAGSPYRTTRPLLDFNILGRTQWTNVTVALSTDLWGSALLMGRPFVEAGYHVPRATRRPTPLDPVEWFGADALWSFSAGIRLHAGRMRSRVGRYGIASSSRRP